MKLEEFYKNLKALNIDYYTFKIRTINCSCGRYFYQKNNLGTVNSFEDYIEKGGRSMSQIINESFSWANSSEGYDYWGKIYDK